MAFPTTITTDGHATIGVGGPFVSTGGNVYVCIPSDNLYNLRILKDNGDPASGFAAAIADVVIGSGGDVLVGIAAVQLGNVIHIVTRNGNGSSGLDIRYHAFTMDSDSFSVNNELVKSDDSTAAAQGGQYSMPSIAVRSGGTVVVQYNGPAQNVLGTDYERVYIARRTAGAWSADIALDAGGVVHWIAGTTVLGSGNRVHLFFRNDNADTAYQRCLNSANSLEAMPAAFGPAGGAWEFMDQRGTLLTATGEIHQPYYQNFQAINEAVFASADVPTLSAGSNVTSPTAALAGTRHMANMNVDGTTLWHTFLDPNLDIYTQSRISGTAWTAPSVFLTTSANHVYSNIFTRGAALVIGIVYNETDPKYTEKTLSSIPVTTRLLRDFTLYGGGS